MGDIDEIQPVPTSARETGEEYEGNRTDDQIMVRNNGVSTSNIMTDELT